MIIFVTMIQPGGKNWIEKYFSLLEEGVFNFNSIQKPSEVSTEEFLHQMFFDSGIIFGFPSEFLFFKDQETISNWTIDEKLKFLLFECLLAVYLFENADFNKDEFLNSLQIFYEDFNTKNPLNVLELVQKESEAIKLETILKSRTHIKPNLINKLWANYIGNSLVYLDVLTYRAFLIEDRKFNEIFQSYVLWGLRTTAAVSYADGEIDPSEQLIISIFLNATNWSETEIKDFYTQLDENGGQIENIGVSKNTNLLFRLYLMDMAVLTINSDLIILKVEFESLKRLSKYLGLSTENLEDSMTIISHFIIKNNDKVSFLTDKSHKEQIYNNFSKRWIKILGRNKDKLADELKESKELVALVNKSFTQELDDDEKEKVKTQFRDIIKSIPALAIFMLPGGMILLPIILKIVPDLIPTAFKRNEV